MHFSSTSFFPEMAGKASEAHFCDVWPWVDMNSPCERKFRTRSALWQRPFIGGKTNNGKSFLSPPLQVLDTDRCHTKGLFSSRHLRMPPQLRTRSDYARRPAANMRQDLRKNTSALLPYIPVRHSETYQHHNKNNSNNNNSA